MYCYSFTIVKARYFTKEAETKIKDIYTYIVYHNI